eukprot:7377746-Prymnesium_polylepis.1
MGGHHSRAPAVPLFLPRHLGTTRRARRSRRPKRPMGATTPLSRTRRCCRRTSSETARPPT